MGTKLREITINEQNKGKNYHRVRITFFLGGVSVIALTLFVLSLPFFMSIEYKFNPKAFILKAAAATKKKQSGTQTANQSLYPHSLYSLVIPKIGVNTTIERGANGYEDLNKGAWYYPNNTTPDNPGNVVLLGHRFEYLPPNKTTFYLLDKLKSNDDIIIYWNNKQYTYKVNAIKVIAANQEQAYIDLPTNTKQVLLITCTPLWTSTKRLLVYANLV